MSSPKSFSKARDSISLLPSGEIEQRNKLEQMASLENRSVSNLVELMADERWKRLAEQNRALHMLKPLRRR